MMIRIPVKPIPTFCTTSPFMTREEAGIGAMLNLLMGRKEKNSLTVLKVLNSPSSRSSAMGLVLSGEFTS